MRPNGLMVPSADQYAHQMVNSIGLSTSQTGYWCHELFVGLLALLPKWLVVSQTRKMMDSTRRRWERKQQQKKE